jgi:hypothetical protein
MGRKTFKAPDERFDREAFVLFDDFVDFTDKDAWTVAVAGTGTAAHEGPGRSNFALFSTADKDAAVLATTHELYKFVAGKEIYAEASIKFTAPSTQDGSVFFGFADAMDATVLSDTAGAITINDSGAAIYKVQDESVYRFHTEIGGTAVDTVSTTTAGAGATQNLKISVIPVSSTVFEARGFVDGVQLKDANGAPIMHRITLGTATDMDFGALIKGHHADDFTCLVDYVYAAQAR